MEDRASRIEYHHRKRLATLEAVTNLQAIDDKLTKWTQTAEVFRKQKEAIGEYGQGAGDIIHLAQDMHEVIAILLVVVRSVIDLEVSGPL